MILNDVLGNNVERGMAHKLQPNVEVNLSSHILLSPISWQPQQLRYNISSFRDSSHLLALT
jgi:hypothetical protein